MGCGRKLKRNNGREILGKKGKREKWLRKLERKFRREGRYRRSRRFGGVGRERKRKREREREETP